MDSTSRLKPILPILLLVVAFWSVSLAGLDFGVHWDETRAKFDSVRRSAETGILIQSVNEPDGFSYNYGGVNYWLTWVGFTPEVLSYFERGIWTRQALANVILPVVYSMEARIRVRGIYVILSGLAIVWLYLLCHALGRSRHEALLAAAILGLSWEVGYHSRWVAPDTVVMQFALLSFLCLVRGLQKSSIGWFRVAAVVVGLTAGTKYPGAFILPFLLLALIHSMWRSGQRLLSIAKQAFLTALITTSTFVITTPGVILDPFRFVLQLREQQLTYADGWYGYTVPPGIPHFWAIIQYFSFEVFSPFAPLSAVLALFCLTGIVALVFERRLVPFLIGGFCIVYLAFFAQQSAMLVRNYLVVVPFLAMAASHGIVAVAERSSKRIAYAGVVVILLANFVWDLHAVMQIRKRGEFEYALRQFESYARGVPDETLLVSYKLLNDLHRLPDPIPMNVTGDSKASFTKVVFLQSEGADEFWATWPANQRDLYDQTFGALEVNLNRYPTFIGNPRVLVVRRDQLAHFPINAEYLATPDFAVSKTVVVAGQDSYQIRVKRMRGTRVVLRYTVEGGPEEEFAVTLKEKGEMQFDINADVRKGAYRFLAYRRASERNWYNVDATVTVK